MDNEKDKRSFQRDIIDELSNILNLYYEYIPEEKRYENVLDNACVTEEESFFNSVRAGGMSALSYLLVESYMDNDPGYGYSFFTIFGATMVGKLLFDWSCKKDFTDEQRKIVKVYLQRIELHKMMLFGLVKEYVNSFCQDVDEFDFKEELLIMFDNNLEYIEDCKGKKFSKDFDYDEVCYVFDYLIGDKDLYKSLEKKSVRIRKRF